MKITLEYGSHTDNHENYIDILPCVSIGKLGSTTLNSKSYFVVFEWILWYIVVYFKVE